MIHLHQCEDISPSETYRVKHSAFTSKCGCGKWKIFAGSMCAFYHAEGDVVVSCGHQGDRLAHVQKEGTSDFRYVVSCATCNNNHRATMYVKPGDFSLFECKNSCKAEYRNSQTAFHKDYTWLHGNK
jgi:hypothetical protein